MTEDEYVNMTATDIQRAVLSRNISPVEIVTAALSRLEKVEPSLNAFVTVTQDKAISSAKAIERKLLNGESVGLLAGIPLSIKDLIDVAGVPTTYGSRVMAANVAESDAPAVERALQAGACVLGKTTTTEFGAKSGESSSPLSGVTRNAWNLMKTAGGSSSGAATSVSARVSPLAISTDGGGSSRIPPSFCGVLGIKPQFGRIPIFPSGATPTLSHVGIIARNVCDASLLLSSLSGYDARDPHSIHEDPLDWMENSSNDVSKMRIAWSPTLGYAKPTQEILSITGAAVGELQRLGCNIDEVNDVFDKDPLDVFTAEFYAGAVARIKPMLAKHINHIDPTILKSIEPAADLTLGDYNGFVQSRYQIRETVRQIFEKYDALITPTVPTVAFDIGHESPPEFPELDANSWVYYTYPFNLSGNPAASIPCGFSSSGMPVGLQIITAAYAENTLLSVAAAYEMATSWNHQFPTI
ncbi:MAG: amidase family protein [Pseudomonadales bacterium]